MSNFFDEVYSIVRLIPVGYVVTYGDIARATGYPRMSRQVGWALHVNPDTSTIPCHRVVNRFGKLTPAFAFGGIGRQAELLQGEGVAVDGDTVDLQIYRYVLGDKSC